jgi:hypothetical protein
MGVTNAIIKARSNNCFIPLPALLSYCVHLGAQITLKPDWIDIIKCVLRSVQLMHIQTIYAMKINAFYRQFCIIAFWN